MTPSRLALTILAAFGSGSVESIADLLREFNFRYGTNTAYKAFYNRLAHDGFAVFMKALVGHLLSEFAVRTLGPSAGAAIEDFEDIVIQDGSSFVVKESLRSAFPGRFKNVEPAAVELHATFSGFLDEVTDVTLTADKEGERQFRTHSAEHLWKGWTTPLMMTSQGRSVGRVDGAVESSCWEKAGESTVWGCQRCV